VKGKPLPLVKGCFNEFRQLANSRKRAAACTTVRLWLGDALVLATDGSLPAGSFSSVDTSDLADDLGLLPTVVACQPLLAPHPLAALFTSVAAWHSCGAKTAAEYLQRALPIDLRLAPTLLGLRLLSQPELGREHCTSVMQREGSVTDTLLWQPAVGGRMEARATTAAPLPRLTDSPDLLKGLRALAALCVSRQGSGFGQCGLRSSTTLALLHLLRGGGGSPKGWKGCFHWRRKREETHCQGGAAWQNTLLRCVRCPSAPGHSGMLWCAGPLALPGGRRPHCW
jgi:hypothetical protein